MKLVFIFVLALLLFGCNESENSVKLDGKKLLTNKCASCHNLDMPPKTSEDEPAPPMMAVSFHVRSFVKPTDESQRVSKAIEFVVDYVQNPSMEKSFCDKESLKRYGVMPSQKENVTEDELKAIASYMFTHFTQEKLSEIQKQKAEFDKLSDGDKLALKNRCIGCHQPKIDTVGPSFSTIIDRYRSEGIDIKKSIKNGSKGKYKRDIMPAFKQLSDKELQTLEKWVLKRGNEATEKK